MQVVLSSLGFRLHPTLGRRCSFRKALGWWAGTKAPATQTVGAGAGGRTPDSWSFAPPSSLALPHSSGAPLRG